VREVRLIDPDVQVVEGKALDIRQSSPIESFSTRLSASADLSSASGADVVVLADSVAGAAEHAGEAALAMLRKLLASGISAPIVCAGAGQRELIGLATGELRMPAARIVGSAPLALESALRALAAVAIDGSAVEISLRVLGIPPSSAVVAWEAASASGQPLAAELPPHQIAALAARIPSLWPPGPYALGSAAARVVDAMASGSRRRYSCFVSLGRGRVAAMPIELGPDGVRRVLEPALTRQERTRLENALGGLG
jgi:malate dehydrogenase